MSIDKVGHRWNKRPKLNDTCARCLKCGAYAEARRNVNGEVKMWYWTYGNKDNPMVHDRNPPCDMRFDLRIYSKDDSVFFARMSLTEE